LANPLPPTGTTERELQCQFAADRLGRVNLCLREHLRGARARMTDVEPIHETHVSEPGLLVIDVADLDDDTVFAFQNAIARMWASTVDRTTRDVGQPGVRLRMYTDLRQALTETSLPEQAPAGGTL
jgi:hypothetical protein